MTNAELEEYLDLIVEDLYNGFNTLAASTRANLSREDLADQLQTLAEDICRHWPTCRALHDLDYPRAPEE